MKIARIEIAGFRGFRDRADIRIPSGFAIIQGANGAGKSTLCDAIEFCLVGALSKYNVEKGGKESVADYVWWRGDGKAADHFVRVHFVEADGTPFIIERTRNGCDKTPEEIQAKFCAGPAPENPLGVLVETSLIRDESISAVSLDISDVERYQRVQRALGAFVSRDLASRAEKVGRAADDTHRRNLAGEEAVKKEIATYLSQLSEARNEVIESAEVSKAIDELRSLVPSTAQDTNELISAARSYALQTQANLRSQVAALDRVRQLASELALINTQEFANELAAAKKKMADLNGQIAEAEAAYAAAQKLLAAERAADALASSLVTILAHGSEVGLQDGHCPLCDAVRTDGDFRAAIERGRERLKDTGRRAQEAELAMVDASDRMAALALALNSVRVDLGALEARAASVGRIESEIAEQTKIANIGDRDPSDQGTIEWLSSQAREIVIRIERCLRVLESSRSLGLVRRTEERLSALRAEAEQLSQTSAGSQRAVAAAKLIQHAVTRTAGDMLDENLAMISPLLSELFLRLKPHVDWKNIEYRIRGDVRRFLSLSVGDELNPQFVFSSGQRRVTGLAFLLSVYLARHWCAWRTLMLDDPVQHIDDYRALNLVEVLAAIRRNGQQVICAVEDSALADLLCRRLRATESEPGALIRLEAGAQGVSRLSEMVAIHASPRRILDTLPVSEVG